MTIHNFEMLTHHNPKVAKENLFLGHFISKFMSFSEWQRLAENGPESAKVNLSANYIATDICKWNLSSDMPSVKNNAIVESFMLDNSHYDIVPAGSVGVDAPVFVKNPDWNFENVFRYVCEVTLLGPLKGFKLS